MKKISSEINVDLPSMKAKWGTIDKKNPSFIYLEIGAYITPREQEESYTDNIVSIEKEGRQIIKDAVNRTDCVKKDFIFVTDVAETRIMFGKKSYLSMQIHMGHKHQDKNTAFKDIVSDMDGRWRPVYDEILSTIENNGFSCSKSKK